MDENFQAIERELSMLKGILLGIDGYDYETQRQQMGFKGIDAIVKNLITIREVSECNLKK